MAESTAWVLALDQQLRAAVGEREMVHLIEAPTLLEVPRSPFYCRQVLVWNDAVLPAMDLAAWLRRQPAHRAQTLVEKNFATPQRLDLARADRDRTAAAVAGADAALGCPPRERGAPTQSAHPRFFRNPHFLI